MMASFAVAGGPRFGPPDARGLLPEGASSASSALQGGIKVAKGDVLWGNARKSKAPAEIDMCAAIAATPEGRQIKDEGIEKGSAKYMILIAKAHKRVLQAIRDVAPSESVDCVVKKGTIKENPDGVEVGDLTAEVVAQLESAHPA